MQALATGLQYVQRTFSRQGESSGQYIPIHNCTPFTLQLDGKPNVKSGKELTTPSAVRPAAYRETQYIRNSGRAGSTYGSEIWYTYRFENTPEEATWYLKIFSEGTFLRENARFAVQLFREDKMMAQESLWDKQNQFPSRRPDPECLFRISILPPTTRKDLGAGFNEIPVKIEMDPEHETAEKQTPSTPKVRNESVTEDVTQQRVPETTPRDQLQQDNLQLEKIPKNDPTLSPETETQVQAQVQDLKVNIENTTSCSIDVECENRPLLCGEWTEQLPKKIGPRQHAEGKASDEGVKSTPVFALTSAGWKGKIVGSFSANKELRLDGEIDTMSVTHRYNADDMTYTVMLTAVLPETIPETIALFLKQVKRQGEGLWWMCSITALVLAVLMGLAWVTGTIAVAMEWFGTIFTTVVGGVASTAVVPWLNQKMRKTEDSCKIKETAEDKVDK